MSVEENKTLVRHVVDLWNHRDMDAFYGLLAEEYVEHLPNGDISLEQVKQYAPVFFMAFPDIVFTIMEMVAGEDKVAALINWKATHKGDYMGIRTTGKKIDIMVANIIRIADGRLVEFWNVTDVGLMQQLCVIP